MNEPGFTILMFLTQPWWAIGKRCTIGPLLIPDSKMCVVIQLANYLPINKHTAWALGLQA